MEYTIQTYELCKKYGDCSVGRNVSMHVPKGQIYGLLGRNGAGKTTIMKMVLGLVRKDSGSVTLFNQVMTGYQSGIYARIGSTIESPGFYSNLTAAENLSVFSRLRGKVNENKICDALGVVGLPYQDKKIFSKYSLGMKQRLAIANAIINDLELLILDEPTNGLDPIGMQREYQDRTIRNILTAPVSREKFMAAKLVVWFLWYLISICLSEMIVTAGCYTLFPVEFTTGNMRYALFLLIQNNFFSFIAGIPILWICVKQQALFYPSMLATLGSAVLQAAGLQVSEELILPACVCPWTAVSISGLVEVDTFYYWICLVSIFLCGLVGFMGTIISFGNQDQ